MRDTLKYYILKMEQMIYKDTRIWQVKDHDCNGEKKLPCNCLTGLTLNYLGYMMRNCWHVDLECTFEMNGGIGYVSSKYRGRKLAPVLPKDRNSEKFFGQVFICNKKSVSDDKVYIRIGSFQNEEELEQHIADIEECLDRKTSEAEMISKFMLPFLKTIRTQPIKEESNTLLAMALYLHPNRMLCLIQNYLSYEDVLEKNQSVLRDFFDQYMKFLDALKTKELGYDYGYEFISKFSDLFEKLTNVYIGKWIEQIQDEQKNDFICKALYAAYNRNREELCRRSSYFNKIKAKLKVL